MTPYSLVEDGGDKFLRKVGNPLPDQKGKVLKEIKALFIISTDAHNHKIIRVLKTIKIPTIAPTCFGSRRNHHQGAISC